MKITPIGNENKLFCLQFNNRFKNDYDNFIAVFEKIINYFNGTDLEDSAKKILLIIISDYDKEDNSVILTTEELTDFMNLIFNYLSKTYTNYNTDMLY
jgi:hypothetical protein